MSHPKANTFAPFKLPAIVDETSILDADNPYSILNLVPPLLREAIDNLSTNYYGLSERDLRRKINPCPEVARLRLNFWDEYERAVSQKRKMDLLSLTKGVCSNDYFYTKILKNPDWVAFMTIPPADYQLALREMLELGWDRIREVLLLPITEKIQLKTSVKGADGKQETVYEIIERTNTKLIGEIRQMVGMIDLRVKGAILQKVQVEQRNLNVNVHTDDASPYLATQTMGQLEAMEQRVARLKSEMEDLDAATEKGDILEAGDGLDGESSATSPSAAEDNPS